MNRPALMFAPLALCVALARAQGAPDTLVVTSVESEEFPFTLDREEELQEELEHLSAMMDDPVDLTCASESDLMLIPGFDRTLARFVLDSVSARQSRSARDLGRIPGLSRRAIRAVAPFVSAAKLESEQATRLVSGSVRMKAEAIVSQRPAEPVLFLGNRWKTLFRLMLETKGDLGAPLLKAAVMAEKDAGEIRFADHASGFLWLRPGGGLELTAGDFAVGGALGLALGAWPGVSRASSVARSPAWKSLVARPAASASESVGLRGLLAAYRSRRLEAALFYSNRAVHARLSDSSVVTSFYAAGLFRTASELALRSRTRERALGARLSVLFAEKLRLGVSASQSVFLHRVAAASVAGRGNRHFAVAGVDALLEIGRLELALEFARDGGGATALATALDARLSPNLQARAALRSVERGFASLHGLEASGGICAASLGLRWALVENVRWELSGDQQRTGRMGPGELPLSERTVASRLEADVPGPLSVTLQVRTRFAEESVTATDEYGRTIRQMGQGRAHSARCVVEFEGSADVLLKCGFELRAVRTGSSAKTDRAFCLLNELSWHPMAWIELQVRASSYGIDSYAARIYDWDHAVNGSITQTLLYGSGLHASAHVRLRLGERVVAELHYSETDRALEREIGGRPLPEQFERRTLRAQLDVHF